MIQDRRTQIFNKTDGVCSYCGIRLDPDRWHIEHQTPKSRRGGNELPNLVPSCPACNRLKGTRTVREFRLMLMNMLGTAPVYFAMDDMEGVLLDGLP